jgi:hypothetical protein
VQEKGSKRRRVAFIYVHLKGTFAGEKSRRLK